MEQKLPPHNAEAEMAVLGSMILNPASAIPDVLSTGLCPEEFFKVAHARIFVSICDLSSSGTGIDLVTVKDDLVKKEELEKAGGIEYLASLVETVPTAANAVHYARIVRKWATQRQVLGVSKSIAEKSAAGVELNGELEELAKIAKSIEVGHQVEEEKSLTGSPAQELFMKVADRVKFILYPLLARGCLTQLQGDPKLGKSCFAMILSLACAIGRWVFGRFEYEEDGPCRVGYISYEDGKPRLKRRINEYLGGLGVQPSPSASTFPSNLIVFEKNPDIDLTTKAGERRLRQIVTANRLDVLVIDTFSYIHSAEENSKKEMQPVMAALRKLVEDFPIAVLLVHHTRKSSGQGVESINTRGRGSSAISAAPDIILDWGTRPYPNTTLLQMVSKETSGGECLVKYMEQEDGSVKWAIEDVIDREDVAEIRRKVIDALTKLALTSPEGVTMSTLRGALPDMVESTLRNHIRALVRNGKLTMTKGQGVKGAHIYKLKG